MKLALSVAAAVLIAACPASQDTTYGAVGGVNGRKTSGSQTVGSGSVGTGSGTTGGTQASSASSVGASASSSSSGSCDATWVAQWYDGGFLPAVGECPEGKVELKGRLTDVCNFSPNGAAPLDVPFAGSDYLNPDVQAQTGPCGVYWFCLDAGTALTPFFTASEYVSYLVGALDVRVSSSDIEAITDPLGLQMFCKIALQDVSGVEPPFDTSKATLLVGMPSGSDGTQCDGNSGWTFSLSQPDGGLLDPVPPFAFIVGQSFVQIDAGTSGEGLQLFYNLDPSIGPLVVHGTKLGNRLPDGGERCPDLATRPAVWPYTGEVSLALGVLSFFYYIVE